MINLTSDGIILYFDSSNQRLKVFINVFELIISSFRQVILFLFTASKLIEISDLKKLKLRY